MARKRQSVDEAMRRIFIAIMLLAAIVAATEALSQPQQADSVPGLRVAIGSRVESFGLKRIIQQPGDAPFVYLDDYLGAKAKTPARVLLVSFCASWCEPCRRELPHLLRMSKQYAGQGLGVLMVSIDEDDASIDALRKFMLPHKPSFPVLSDRFHIVSRRFFGDSAPLPANVLISPDFSLLAALTGGAEQNMTTLETLIRNQLATSGAVQMNNPDSE